MFVHMNSAAKPRLKSIFRCCIVQEKQNFQNQKVATSDLSSGRYAYENAFQNKV